MAQNRPSPLPPRGRTTHITSSNGIEIAKALQKESEVVLTVPRTGEGKFGDWLVENLEEIYRDWISQSDDEAGQ